MKFSKTPTNLAILQNGKVIKKLAVTETNAGTYFPSRNGNYIIGSNVQRILTIRELLANGLATSKNKAGELLRYETEKCLTPINEEVPTKAAA